MFVGIATADILVVIKYITDLNNDHPVIEYHLRNLFFTENSFPFGNCWM
jgi:hypothetical protein